MKNLYILVCLLIFISGCGNSGGKSNVLGSVFQSVSGTASEGALITRKTVRLKDAQGKSAINTITDATTGVYKSDVGGLTAPFLVTVAGTYGTYITLAQTAGTANINPITTMVVALAAGTSDMSSLFANLTSEQIAAINNRYADKCVLVNTALRAVLPDGVIIEDYFTGTVSAGTGMDAFFDTYRITVDPVAGITFKTNNATAATVLTIPAATVAANTNEPLPVLVNKAPVANAGIAQDAVINNIVALDGSGSTDFEGYTLTYSWELTSKPADSNVEGLSSATVVKPTFTPDVVGNYVFGLVVNDGKVDSGASTVTITASDSNVAPVANAGPDQTAAVTGTPVTLDGSGSTDANGDTLTYTWEFILKPSGSSAALSSATTSPDKPTFTPDKEGTYVLSLLVYDGKLQSPYDKVTVTVSAPNAAPVANAGLNQSVVTGASVKLDGSDSTDTNGDALIYAWTLTRPTGSTAVLSSTTANKPTFTADVAGSYVVTLIVSDGKLQSSPDTVTITAAAGTP